MKQVTFNIRQYTGGLLEKRGYLFNLSYSKGFTFAVIKEGNEINSSIRWVVSEISTGYAVAFGKWDGTRKAAISGAKKILRKVGANQLKVYVYEIIAEHGSKANYQPCNALTP